MRVFPNGTGILLGLLICFAGAWFFPGGAEWADSFFPLSKSSILVVVIFLIHGWNVRLDVIASVFRGFPNLLFVLGGIFLSPLVFTLILQYFAFFQFDWREGFIYLAILPTTISTCVVYTSMADGDSDSALGYAALSNLFAIIWVPFAWSILVVESGNSMTDQWVTAGRIMLPPMFGLVIFPCYLGWLARKIFLKVREDRQLKIFNRISFLCILLLAYMALAKSISQLGTSEFIQLLYHLFPYLLVFLIFHVSVSWIVSSFLSSDRKLKVAGFYCISQKSLAMGLPMATLLPINDVKVDLLLVCPLIFYHFLQLFVGASFIPALRKWVASRS